MQSSRKDLLAGLIFIGFGLAFAYAAMGYPLGTALRMGPGYFPLLLAGILTLLGLVIVVEGFVGGKEEAVGVIPWRGAALVFGALVFFGYTVRGLGLVPALFVTVFLTALASRRNGPLLALVIAAALTFFCVLIFIYGLGLTIPLLGPWLAF